MHFIEAAERWLSRAHLLQWLVMTLVFAVTTWIAYSSQLPPLLVSILAGVGVTTLAVLAVRAVYGLARRYPVFFGLHVPFSKVVRILYARTEGTYYNNEISKTNKTLDEKLDFMGNMLLAIRKGKERRARIYAKKPHSPVSRELTEEQIEHLHWEPGSDDLRDNSTHAQWTEAVVDRFDLYRYARHMRKGDEE